MLSHNSVREAVKRICKGKTAHTSFLEFLGKKPGCSGLDKNVKRQQHLQICLNIRHMLSQSLCQVWEKAGNKVDKASFLYRKEDN